MSSLEVRELYETKRRHQKLLIPGKLTESKKEPPRSACKELILQDMLVEAAGVELFSVLTARKLLILRMARGAKKAPLPIPLYVYCTKILSSFCPQLADHRPSIPQFGYD